MCVRFSRAFIAACTASATLAFLSSRDEFASATFPPLGAYPARMYAAVAFKSIRYSATKRCCFGVRFIGLAPIGLLESALHRLAALATISGRCLDQLPFGVMQSGGRLPVTHPARCGVVLWPYGDGLRISPTKFRAPGMWYAYMPEAATLSASLCTPRGCRPWRGGEPVARDAKKPAFGGLLSSGHTDDVGSLRRQLSATAARRGAELYFPELEFCTDNGAMIALVGALRLESDAVEAYAFSVKPRWPLESMAAATSATR